MKIDVARSEFCLQERHPLPLEDARDLEVECAAGTVWITQPGEPDDVFLQPGETFRIRSNGRVLVEAIGCARVRIRAVPRRPADWRPRQAPEFLPALATNFGSALGSSGILSRWLGAASSLKAGWPAWRGQRPV